MPLRFFFHFVSDTIVHFGVGVGAGARVVGGRWDEEAGAERGGREEGGVGRSAVVSGPWGKQANSCPAGKHNP